MFCWTWLRKRCVFKCVRSGRTVKDRGEWGVLHWENHSSYKLKSSTDLEITKTRLMHTKYTPCPGAQSWQLKTFTLAQRALITTLLAGFNLTIFKFFSSWCGFKSWCFDSRGDGLSEYQTWHIQCLHQDGWWRFELENVSVADSGTGRAHGLHCGHDR